MSEEGLEAAENDREYIELNDVYKERKDLTRAVQIKLGKKNYSVGNSNARAHIFLCKYRQCLLYKFTKSRKDLSKNFQLNIIGKCQCEGQPLVIPQNFKLFNVKKKISTTMTTEVPTTSAYVYATTAARTSNSITSTASVNNNNITSTDVTTETTDTSINVSTEAEAAATLSRTNIYDQVMKMNQENANKNTGSKKKIKNPCKKCFIKSADQGCVECQVLTICKECSICWITLQENEGIIEPRTCPQCSKTYPLYDLQKPSKKVQIIAEAQTTTSQKESSHSTNVPLVQTSIAVPVSLPPVTEIMVPLQDKIAPIQPPSTVNDGTTTDTADTAIYGESQQSKGESPSSTRVLYVEQPRPAKPQQKEQQQPQKRRKKTLHESDI